VRKDYDILKSYTKNLLVWFLSRDISVPRCSGS